METPSLAVAVVAYRAWPEVLECLRTLTEQKQNLHHIFVVDNGSGDGSAAEILERFANVQIVAEYPNRGYGAGLNAGLRAALATGSDYCLLMAQDCLLAPGAVGQLVDALEADPQAAAATPVVGLRASPQVIFQVGGIISPRTWDFVSIWPEGTEGGDITAISDQSVRRVDWGDGSVMLLRSSAIGSFGFFDESYYVYMEDADFFVRIRRAGWHVLSVPAALAWQEPGRHNTRLHTRNRMFFLERHAPRRILCRELLRQLSFVVREASQDKASARQRACGMWDYLMRRTGALRT
jgi:N-acetylglucosaminyl-diphospho-decaprenol L-rhamnosyltransferase